MFARPRITWSVHREVSASVFKARCKAGAPARCLTETLVGTRRVCVLPPSPCARARDVRALSLTCQVLGGHGVVNYRSSPRTALEASVVGL